MKPFTFSRPPCVTLCALGQNYLGPDGAPLVSFCGILAQLHGGETIHSWAGLGLANKPLAHYLAKLDSDTGKGKLKNRLQQAKVLVIDDASPISRHLLFHLLEPLARRARGIDQSFGGLSLVITVDFLQPLPWEDGSLALFADDKDDIDSRGWASLLQGAHVVGAATSHRFGRDEAYSSLLRDMRNPFKPGAANWAARHWEVLQDMRKPLKDDAVATHLFFTHDGVERYEEEFLKKQPKDNLKLYHAWFAKPLHRARLQGQRKVCEKRLFVGCPVLYTCNDGDLRNGSFGFVTGFEPLGSVAATALNLEPLWGLWTDRADIYYPWVRFRAVGGAGDEYREPVLVTPMPFRDDDDTGETIALGFPLVLGVAMTVLKSFGSTLPAVILDCNGAHKNAFQQHYLAFSRVQDSHRIQLIGFDPARVRSCELGASAMDALARRNNATTQDEVVVSILCNGTPGCTLVWRGAQSWVSSDPASAAPWPASTTPAAPAHAAAASTAPGPAPAPAGPTPATPAPAAAGTRDCSGEDASGDASAKAKRAKASATPTGTEAETECLPRPHHTAVDAAVQGSEASASEAGTAEASTAEALAAEERARCGVVDILQPQPSCCRRETLWGVVWGAGCGCGAQCAAQAWQLTSPPRACSTGQSAKVK